MAHPSLLVPSSIAKATLVPQGNVGVNTAADGDPLDPGRLLGKAITNHRNFQDAEHLSAPEDRRAPRSTSNARRLSNPYSIGRN